MYAKEINQTTEGWQWTLYSSEGDLIAVGPCYQSREECISALNAFIAEKRSQEE